MLGIALAVGGVAVRGARAAPCGAARRGARARVRAGEPGGGRVPVLGGRARGPLGGGRAGARAAPPCSALPVLVGGGAMAVLFPEGGDDRFVATAFWPMLASRRRRPRCSPRAAAPLRAGGAAVPRRARRRVRVPTPFGQNALRLRRAARARRCSCSPRARARRALALADRRRRAALPAVAAGGARRRRGARRPVDQRGVLQPTRATSCAAWRSPGERVEVAVHAQPLGGRPPGERRAARARLGAPARREGQPALLRRPAADRRALPRAGCATNAVRWVALPNAPLDYSAAGRGAAARARRAVPQARLRVAATGGSGRCATRRRRPPAARA